MPQRAKEMDTRIMFTRPFRVGEWLIVTEPKISTEAAVANDLHWPLQESRSYISCHLRLPHIKD